MTSGKADLRDDLFGLLERARRAGARDLGADLDHRLLEELPVLGQAHGVLVGADQLDAPLVEDARGPPAPARGSGPSGRPTVGRIASGRSFSTIRSRNSGVSGST